MMQWQSSSSLLFLLQAAMKAGDSLVDSSEYYRLLKVSGTTP